MEAIILGCGEAFDETLPNTSLLVKSSVLLLLDCGFSAASQVWQAAPDPSAEGGTTAAAAQPVTLDPAVTAKLRTLMRAGVSSGAASAASAPGDPVYGVAAEVTQTDKKERTKLSWFVGWQGDVAVAVLAKSGDLSAAPAIAGSFFRTAQPQT